MLTPTEHQSAALAAFVACVEAGLNPSMNAYTWPHNGEASYEILIGGGLAGVIHEQIETVLRIATDHGGRAFVDTREIHRTDAEWKHGRLTIVWPRPATSPGPGDLSEREEAEVVKRGGKVTRPAKAPAKRARKAKP